MKNERAFPVIKMPEEEVLYCGLTKFEYYAVQSLQGLLANHCGVEYGDLVEDAIKCARILDRALSRSQNE